MEKKTSSGIKNQESRIKMVHTYAIVRKGKRMRIFGPNQQPTVGFYFSPFVGAKYSEIVQKSNITKNRICNLPFLQLNIQF